MSLQTYPFEYEISACSLNPNRHLARPPFREHSPLHTQVPVPVLRHVLLQFAGGGLGADDDPMHFFQMAEIDSDVTKHFCTEFAAHEFLQPALTVMEFHVRAQAASTRICLATNPTAVWPAVSVRVHVVSEVLFELEVVVTDRTFVPRLLDARESISERRAGLRGRAVVLLTAEIFRSE